MTKETGELYRFGFWAVVIAYFLLGIVYLI